MKTERIFALAVDQMSLEFQLKSNNNVTNSFIEKQ